MRSLDAAKAAKDFQAKTIGGVKNNFFEFLLGHLPMLWTTNSPGTKLDDTQAGAIVNALAGGQLTCAGVPCSTYVEQKHGTNTDPKQTIKNLYGALNNGSIKAMNSRPTTGPSGSILRR